MENRPREKRSINGRSALPAFKGALIEANRNPDAPQPLCVGQADVYTDYTETPKARDAKAMCEPCPLKDLCLANAKRIHPGWGVFGGVAWVYGKPTVDLRTYS